MHRKFCEVWTTIPEIPADRHIKIGQKVADISLFNVFQNGGRPPYWIFWKIEFLGSPWGPGAMCVEIQNFI